MSKISSGLEDWARGQLTHTFSFAQKYIPKYFFLGEGSGDPLAQKTIPGTFFWAKTKSMRRLAAQLAPGPVLKATVQA